MFINYTHYDQYNNMGSVITYTYHRYLL